jgi:hypothetical protein
MAYFLLAKKAGLSENLDQLGVPEETKQWVLSQSPQLLAVIMPVLKSNPSSTIQELSTLTPEEKTSPYTDEEKQQASALEPSVAKWYLIQCRKNRQNQTLYLALQQNIYHINNNIKFFGNNLANFSVPEAILYVDRVAPIWNNISSTDPDFRSWAVQQLLSSPQ